MQDTEYPNVYCPNATNTYWMYSRSNPHVNVTWAFKPPTDNVGVVWTRLLQNSQIISTLPTVLVEQTYSFIFEAADLAGLTTKCAWTAT